MVCIYKVEGGYEDTFCPKKDCVPLCPIIKEKLNHMGIRNPKDTNVPKWLVEQQMKSTNAAS